MTILFIDTSQKEPLLGLIIKNKIACIRTGSNKPLSQELFPLIQELLEETGIEKTKLQAIAVGIGPGSFNGSRTGAVVGMSLAFGLKIPCINCPSPIVYLGEVEGEFFTSVKGKKDAYAMKGRLNFPTLQIDFEGFIPLEEAPETAVVNKNLYTPLCLYIMQKFNQKKFQQIPEMIYFHA